MQVSKTELDGVLQIIPNYFADYRGKYIELYNRGDYKDLILPPNAKHMMTYDPFIQDDVSYSRRNVLRGIHGDNKTWKLVTCLLGMIKLVVVNYDPTSPQYKQWEAHTLSETNRIQILIPPKFGNGHYVLSEQAIFHYKQSSYYEPELQFTIAWNDPELDIDWGLVALSGTEKKPITSERDKGL